MRYIEVRNRCVSSFFEVDWPEETAPARLEEFRQEWNGAAKVPDSIEFADVSHDAETRRRFTAFTLRVGLSYETGPQPGWIKGAW